MQAAARSWLGIRASMMFSLSVRVEKSVGRPLNRVGARNVALHMWRRSRVESDRTATSRSSLPATAW
jgi:hypothetical protein